ncbi:MAG: SDR family oxidoreductase [Oceanicola sp.]|nr:SDR family oxidoreductase [Oceanicola sp.]
MPKFAKYPSLDGQTVFVSGGGSGIGADIVTAFAEQGARVGFVDIDAAAGERVLDKIADLGGQAHFEQLDLRDVGAIKEGFARMIAALGAPVALVNNAARDDRHDWREVDEAYYDERIATNLRHMFFSTQACAPAMIEAGKGGAIVNMGSNSWWQGMGGMPVYTTSKSGVHGMTRSFARDLGPHGIRVNTVVPGWIMTERQKELWVNEEDLKKQLERQCIPEPIDPVYVARMVLWLCSDDSAMCSANNFFVEGGAV